MTYYKVILIEASLMVKTVFNIIKSDSNPYFKEVCKIKQGKSKDSLFLVEGEDLVFEANKANSLVELIYLEEKDINPAYKHIKTTIFNKNLIKDISSYQSLPSVIGICKKEYSKDIGKRCVYLDNIQDPGNAGTIIRTALAFGFSSLVLSLDSVSLYNSKVIQSTKGAIFHLPICRKDLLNISKGYNIYLTTLDGIDIEQVDELVEPYIIVFGNEGNGIKKEYYPLGTRLTINIQSIDSLNVASSAAIFLHKYSTLRRR